LLLELNPGLPTIARQREITHQNVSKRQLQGFHGPVYLLPFLDTDSDDKGLGSHRKKRKKNPYNDFTLEIDIPSDPVSPVTDDPEVATDSSRFLQSTYLPLDDARYLSTGRTWAVVAMVTAPARGASLDHFKACDTKQDF
ncbi:hypothetical protein Bbelb_442110, partial [Branchiostoma belcheri]